jgi:hypothetical protein
MLKFENCYQRVSDNSAAGIRALWKTETLLADEAATERLKEVVYVILDPDSGAVAGVSTAVKKRMNMLNNNHLYEFRCYIGEKFRVAGLDVKLSRLTFDFLETLANDDNDKPVGIFTVLENETLKERPVWRRAVWPELEMYFVGYTKTGNPIRVHYFKDARI